MKVLIVGDKDRAVAWEQHLRRLSMVREVIISPTLDPQNQADAAILLDDSVNNIHLLHDAIKNGLHSYLVSKLPTAEDMLETIYHTAAEANVHVQFSHWPSISTSMQWTRQQIGKPDLIQIQKEIVPVNFKINPIDFEHMWVDELALVVKYLGSNVHRIEVKPVRIEGVLLGLHLTLRFENGSLATLQCSITTREDRHQRFFSNRQLMIRNDVISQKSIIFKINDQKRITVREKTFDPSDTAARSITQFFKSIQMGRETIFTPYDALRTAQAREQVLRSI